MNRREQRPILSDTLSSTYAKNSLLNQIYEIWYEQAINILGCQRIGSNLGRTYSLTPYSWLETTTKYKSGATKDIASN